MSTKLNETEILAWLREEEPTRLEALWQQADETRRAQVGDAVHLRGLIEISNHCVRQCAYCGLRAGNRSLPRYRMEADEIFAAAREAVGFGYGTVVLQAGEDYGFRAEWLADLVRRIKRETPLAVTLSLGERLPAELALWREAGADRYLLRFETSDPALFEAIHPPMRRPGASESAPAARGFFPTLFGLRPSKLQKQAEAPADALNEGGGTKRSESAQENQPEHSATARIAMLHTLRELGYQVGSGVMVGIPGQTYESLARDISLFSQLDLDMIGIGPFIPHPDTPLGSGELQPVPTNGTQAPATELMVYKAVALTRLMRPDANIPSTSALATINKVNGRELGLRRGANVVMPNLTPIRYRRLYQIYPAKACIDETGTACNGCLIMRIASIGRHPGRGPGGRRLGGTETKEALC